MDTALYKAYIKSLDRVLKVGEQEHFHTPGNRTSLQSPFAYLQLDEVDNFIPPQKLSLKFEYLSSSSFETSSPNDLILSFKEAIISLPNPDDNKIDRYRNVETQLSLLEFYLGTVPAGDGSFSLYDHARIQTGINLCLHEDGPETDSFLFLKGDLSGIQDYIFDVVSKGAARSLKARSFRVQAVTKLYLRYLIKELQLSPAHVFFEGGGNFFLFVPKSKQEQLDTCRAQIARGIIYASSPNEGDSSDILPLPEQLKLFLGYTEVPVSAISESFNPYWEKVQEQLNLDRLGAFNRLNQQALFDPLIPVNHTVRQAAEASYFKGRLSKINDASGIHISSVQHADIYNWFKSQKVRLTDPDNAEDKITRQIPDPLSLGSLEMKLVNGKSEPDSWFFHRFRESRIISDAGNPKESVQESFLDRPRPFHFSVTDLPCWNDQLLHFYQKEIEEEKQNNKEEEDQTFNPGDLIPFNMLGKFAYRRTGTDKIAVMKMDVDDLGELFRKGQLNLGQYAYLARALKWFFEGHINLLLNMTIAEALKEASQVQQARYEALQVHDHSLKDNLYIIFSGGDDFMLVGAWDMVMEFAWIVREAFRRFSLKDSGVSVSAGIVMVDPKFPVSRFSALAEEALEDAKNLPGKNAISVFGQAIKWSDFRQAIAIKNVLYQLVGKDEDAEPRSFITKVQNSMRGFEGIHKGIRRKGGLDLKRLWRLSYYVRDAKKENQALIKKELIQRYETLLLNRLNKSSKESNPVLIGVAARWAEFLTRNLKNKQ